MLTLAAAVLAALIGIVVTNTAIIVSLPVLYFLFIAFAFTVIATIITGVDYQTYNASIDAIDHIAISLIFVNLMIFAGLLGSVTWPIFAIWLGITFIPILFKNI